MIVITMDENIFIDIWELYGLRSNPFSTSPISVMGGILPLVCFVGRVEQIKQLGKTIGSKGGSRSLVYGDVGVGKTTFVNIVRRYAVDEGYFTPFQEIAINENWTPNEFILNTLGAIFTTIQLLQNSPINKDTSLKLETLVQVVFSDTNLNIGAFGFSGGYAKDRKPGAEITQLTLINFFKDICAEINRYTEKDIVIHYNNLEIFKEKTLKVLFENLRDFFQTDGVHFIFVGNQTVKSYLQSVPRFASTLSDTPILIETLQYREIKEIITKRFESLQIENLKYVIPFKEECLKSLFDLWGGNIRNILNSLSTAVQEVTKDKPLVMNQNRLVKTLKKILEKRYYSEKLRPRAKEILMEVVKRDEITNKGLANIFHLPSSNISKYLKDLENSGCVSVRRIKGRDKFWSAEPYIKWALLEEVEEKREEINQIPLNKWLIP